MSSTSSSLPSEIRDQLVAYLDGELDEASTQSVERTLAENSTARSEVESLTRTFEMLDELPRPRASDEFTTRTIASLPAEAAAAPIERRTGLFRIGRPALLVAWVAGLSLSVLFGVLAAGLWSDDESAQLVRELPLMNDLDVYTEVGSIEYLKQLHNSGVLNDDDEPKRP